MHPRLVLHGQWIPHGGLLFWAEDARRLERGYRPREREGERSSHPFAAARKTLHTLLSRITGFAPGDLHVIEDDPCVVALPSDEHGPLPSPRLEGLREAVGSAPAPACWKVPAYVLAWGPGIGVIGSLRKAPGCAGDRVEVGGDLRFLVDVYGMVRFLVERGAVLPRILEHRGEFGGTWAPFPDIALTDKLLRAVGRAAPRGVSARPLDPDNPESILAPEVTIERFVEQVTDLAVRIELVPRTERQARRWSRKSGPEARFLESLVRGEARIEGEPPEKLRELAVALASWRDRSQDPARKHFQTLLRVSESGSEDLPFQAEVLVRDRQALHAPVPMARFLNTRDGLHPMIEDPRGTPFYLALRDLHRTLTVAPMLEEFLVPGAPEALLLDSEATLRLLEQLDYLGSDHSLEVEVPSWWLRRTRLSLEVEARARAEAVVGIDALCDFDCRLALGDTALTPEDLDVLRRATGRLIRLASGWVVLEPGELQAARRFLDWSDEAREGVAGDRGDGDDADAPALVAPLIRTLRLILGLEEPPGGVPLGAVDLQGWLKGLLDCRSGPGPAPRLPTPENFRGKLRPYQEVGLAWLSFMGARGMGACLADDMGLGKTVQVLALLARELQESADEPPPDAPGAPDPNPGPAKDRATLLVAPTSLLGNWVHEAARFVPELEVYLHHGPRRARGKDLLEKIRQVDMVVTSYDLVRRDRELRELVSWERLVFDEAHHVKNPRSKVARALRQVEARARVAMTGTPIENRVLELWSLMEILDPGLLGSEREFKARFADPIERSGRGQAIEALQGILSPFLLRRMKTAPEIAADLPDRLEFRCYCELTAEQVVLYEQVVEQMMERLEDLEPGQHLAVVGSALTRLKQVCDHPVLIEEVPGQTIRGRSGKLGLLEELLATVLAAGEKAVVFTQFRTMAELLVEHLERLFSRDVLTLHGEVTRRERDRVVRRFQRDPEVPVLVATLKVGGVGLNLTAANHAIHFDRWWNPAVEDQATDRVFRIGQTRRVQVRKLICLGTLEEKIDELLRRKRELARQLVRPGTSWITELPVEELRRLVTYEGLGAS